MLRLRGSVSQLKLAFGLGYSFGELMIGRVIDRRVSDPGMCNLGLEPSNLRSRRRTAAPDSVVEANDQAGKPCNE